MPLDIAYGLFFGNRLGVLGFCWIAVKLGVAKLPLGATWLQLYGVALLCGIGLTMGLFISSLAFEHRDPGMGIDERLGILVGSLASALVIWCCVFTPSKLRSLTSD